ncbi:transcription initiation factor TFIID subunit 9 [Strigomonas culicis]|uniref:Transcription initiation factor TFIID subunit 9 n=1 Tax=Strigomonas culicis TaxID=28005 RepID=S9UYK1_9TRYP|nr:transcription initiation factor TFIID subunit 9 [Strigomonas culicis]|eukprot:EPY33824.1 transcription initiation factor TFIID subunit 9 [Strigomonas culicis]
MEQPKGINILVTGTPGTGKTSLAALLVQELDEDHFEHIEVGKVVKEQRFYTAYDAEFDTHTIEEDDEDRLLDYLEPILVKGGQPHRRLPLERALPGALVPPRRGAARVDGGALRPSHGAPLQRREAG